MMRYMVLLSMSEQVGPPPPALQAAMGAGIGEAFAAGTMTDAGGLSPLRSSTTFVLRRGALERVDGPFAEAKEVVGGYAVLEVRSHEEAAEMARRMMAIHSEHWPGWEGRAEVRRISGPDDDPGGQ